MKKGRLIVISGPSGVGKGTVVKALMERDPQVKLSVSATTRPIRPNEVDGVHYYFISHEEFEKMIDEDRFLEHAQYVGNRYGTPEEPVNQMLESGFDVILEIEVQGGLQVMQRRPDAISIFIVAPSFEILGGRLRGRGDTDEEKVLMRLQQARMEYLVAPQYQYIVVNDRLEDAVSDVQSILRAEALKTEHQQHLLKEAL
ncbi:MAG: guanylate kinase [Oscillospiraceae bacterium]|nr:guanylate kinase [Oscillospiraceae bacterium]